MLKLNLGSRVLASTLLAGLTAFFCQSLRSADLLSATANSFQEKNKVKIHPKVPYIDRTDVHRTLDLYLPTGLKIKPPLVIFIEGHLWKSSGNEPRTDLSLAEALLPNGIALAFVRYRPAPAYRHPAAAQDVAAAVAHLMREANQYGYDSGRIFLAGHSTGAYLAALIALDSTYLRAHPVDPRLLAGVIAISGVYDLLSKTESTEDQKLAIQQIFGESPQTLKSASPINHVAIQAPPFLILAGSGDSPGSLVDAKKFADALRSRGHSRIEQFIVPDRDHLSVMQLKDKDNPARSLLLEFLNAEPLPPDLALVIDAKRKWRNPPFSTLPFWEHKELIRSYPIDRRFVRRLLPIYENYRYELREWPLERYYAIDLFSYLDSLPREKAGRGNYLMITNIRKETIFWSRRQLEPYKPVLVVGIDDEKNLFRLAVFYRAQREYSWKTAPRPPVMVRPVGGFIHFLKEPPLEFLRQPSHDALTAESFQWVDQDPRAPLKDIPKEIYEVMTFQNGCVYCHTFRGVGARSHHTRASDGAPHGGFALPLEEYPPSVWDAFLFKQEETAAKIGASPNLVDEKYRQALHQLVIKSRDQQSRSGR